MTTSNGEALPQHSSQRQVTCGRPASPQNAATAHLRNLAAVLSLLALLLACLLVGPPLKATGTANLFRVVFTPEWLRLGALLSMPSTNTFTSRRATPEPTAFSDLGTGIAGDPVDGGAAARTIGIADVALVPPPTYRQSQAGLAPFAETLEEATLAAHFNTTAPDPTPSGATLTPRVAELASLVEAGKLTVPQALMSLALNRTNPTEADGLTVTSQLSRLWAAIDRRLPTASPQYVALTSLALVHFGRSQRRLLFPEILKPLKTLMQKLIEGDMLFTLSARQLVQVLWALAIADMWDESVVPPALQRLREGLVADLCPIKCVQLAWALAHFKLHDAALMESIWARLQEGELYRQLSARGVANFVWAHARLGIHNEPMLWTLVDVALRPGNLRLMNAQDVANIAYSYAVFRVEDPRLMDALANVAMQKHVLAGMTAQGVCNLAWAFAKMRLRNAALFDLLKRRAVKKDILLTYTGKGMSILLWAYATLGMECEDLFQVFAAQVLNPTNLRKFSPQALVVTMWALASLAYTQAYKDSSVVNDLSRIAVEPAMLAAFNAQDVATTAWAFAHLGVYDMRAVYLLAQRAMEPEILSAYKPIELCMAATSFALLQPPPVVMLAIANRAVEADMIPAFQARGLAILALAYGKLGLKIPTLVAALTRRLMDDDVVRALTAQGLTLVVRAWAMLQIIDEPLMQRLAARAMEADVLHNFTPQAVVAIATSFSSFNIVNPPLMTSLAYRATNPDVLYSFNPRLCADLIYAYRQLGVRDENLFDALERAEERWFLAHG